PTASKPPSSPIRRSSSARSEIDATRWSCGTKRPRRGEPAHRTLSGKLAVSSCPSGDPRSAGCGPPGSLVAERWDQAGPAEDARAPLLADIDDDRLIRLAVADECDNAPFAGRRVLHGALVAADVQRAHGTSISGGCDGYGACSLSRWSGSGPGPRAAGPPRS